MLNPFKEVNWNPDVVERRKFGRSLMIGFPVVALIILLAGWGFKGRWDANLTISMWIGAGGILSGGLFWMVPQIAKPFYRIWFFIGCCMGIVMGNLLFACFYFLVLTPFGWVKRSVKPNFKKGFDRNVPSYWSDVKHTEDPTRYFKQY